MSRENRLASALSPYLLQHKHNPVDWYPWGEEAFARAVAEDKPIFLSIGYATCHWCHVMERESFEDREVAALMNETFVSIKVDREERPDVDHLYMTICQLMQGRCGWPLNVLLTPARQPFYVMTYLPRASRQGRMGMLDFVPRIAEVWATRRQDLEETAQALTQQVHRIMAQPAAAEGLEPQLLHRTFQQLQQRYDPEHGGFGPAPKFPSPHQLLFLLRYADRFNQAEAITMAVHTLRRMRAGGLFDHVGYGFHRYATDEAWLLPHFEKMLYDQALLVLAYTEAYQATGEPHFREVVHEVLAYVLRDMTSPEGAFYAAEDADSEGHEGKFYVWTVAEVQALLDPPLAEAFLAAFGFEAEGNFEDEATRRRTGANIPHLKRGLDGIAQQLDLTEDVLAIRLEEARKALFEERERRIHPLKDDKVLTDWNGLMICAFAQAGYTFQEPAYIEAAQQAADFVLKRMQTPEGGLWHRYRQGEAGIVGHADDYAFLGWGLMALYQACFEPRYLVAAEGLMQRLYDHFWDPAHGGLFFSADEADGLIVRTKEAFDGALPSANGIAFGLWHRLGRLTGSPNWLARADALGRFMATAATQAPSAASALMIGLDEAMGPSHEVVIRGNAGADDTEAMLQALRGHYLPRVQVVFCPEGAVPAALETLLPVLSGKEMLHGHATAYVCQDQACQMPTTDPNVMLEQLGVK